MEVQLLVEKMTLAWRELRDLDLDPENPRHERNMSRQAVIAQFVKRENIRRLARDIVENGLSPLERFGAIRDAQNELVVVEGNRRLCALMLLHDPSLAPTPEDRKSFERLAKKFDPAAVELDLTLFASREEADVWLERKHLGENGGLGTRGWDPVQQARHFGETGNTLALALIDYAFERGLLTERPDGVLTTVTRFMSNPFVRKHALLITTGAADAEFRFGGTRTLFNRRLQRLLTDIIEGANGATSRTNAEQREDYAKEHLVPMTDDDPGPEEDDEGGEDQDSSGNTPGGADGRPGTEGSGGSGPGNGAEEGGSSASGKSENPSTRGKLVDPKHFNPSLRDNGLKRILNELHLVSKKTPALAAVGVRIFIEAVTIAYLENRLGRRVTERDKLHVLVNEALTDIEQQAEMNLIDLTAKEKASLKLLRTRSSDGRYVYSAAYLGAVAHGTAFPQWDHLTASWDEIAAALFVLASHCEKPLEGREG